MHLYFFLVVKYRKERLAQVVARNPSMSAVLRDLGLKPGGGTQTNLNRRISEFGIDTSHFTKVAGKLAGSAGENRAKIRERERAWRRDPSKRPRYIVACARRADAEKGVQCDITREFVGLLISKPCVYCGADDIQMTLDRIDNMIGHIVSNCVSCCIRCNLTRRTMPYEAWLVVAEGMRRAREQGLFGSWVCGLPGRP